MAVQMDWRRTGKTWRVDAGVFVYENIPELLAFAVPFIRRGLAEGAACVYGLGDVSREDISDALAAQSVDVERELDRGALTFTGPEEWFGPSPFDVTRALERLRRRAQEVLADFSGLCVAVEMTWALKAGVDADTLATLESIVEQADAPGPTTVAWMYGRAQFDPAFLRRVIQSHAKVIARDGIYLSLSALFEDMAPKNLQHWLRSAESRRVANGGFYFRQGDPSADIYVLTEGKVKLVRTERDGRAVILRVIMPTEAFGYVNAFEGTPQIASAQAIEDSRALSRDVPTILREMLGQPELSLKTIRVMAGDVVSQIDRAQDLITSKVDRRLARVLLRLTQSLGRKTPRGVVVRLALTREELGEMIGATPYSVSRVLADWRRLDILDAQRERILVLDPERLASIAGLADRRTASRTRVRKPLR